MYSYMNPIRRYNAWATRHYVILSTIFLFSAIGSIMFIKQKYGLRDIDSDGAKKGISVFGDQLIYVLILHYLVSIGWSIVRLIKSVILGNYEYKGGGIGISMVSVLLMPYTLILVILYAFIFL